MVCLKVNKVWILEIKVFQCKIIKMLSHHQRFFNKTGKHQQNINSMKQPILTRVLHQLTNLMSILKFRL